MENNNKKLHIVMFPWLAFGHFIPFLELSQQLATRGHHIYFISTPRNLQCLSQKIPENLAPLITLVPLPMPRVENLPPNVEATSDVGFEIGTDLIKKAMDDLQHPLVHFLETSQHPFDWIIYDFCCYWLPPIADKLGIKKVLFSICFTRTAVAWGSNNTKNTWIDLSSPPPWVPFSNSSIYYLPHEAKTHYSINKPNTSGVSDMYRYVQCIKGCDVFAVRSCKELEAEYLQLLAKIENKVVFPIGLLPPSMEVGPRDESWKFIDGWLEKQSRDTVVYIAFGSEFELSQDQLTELALGVELSGVPFFWAFRRSIASSAVLPEGFEERTRDRGVVWKSWVSQLRILSHESIGGFLTHCGWSSIIEGLQFGKPLVMVPLGIDHGFYARFMVEKKVGIEIPKKVDDGLFVRTSVAESIKVVLKSEDGRTYRDEAKKLSSIFGDKSLHGVYVDKFSDYLRDNKPTRDGTVKLP